MHQIISIPLHEILHSTMHVQGFIKSKNSGGRLEARARFMVSNIQLACALAQVNTRKPPATVEEESFEQLTL